MARGRQPTPFSQPQSGDVFRHPVTGDYWTVISGMHNDIDFVVHKNVEREGGEVIRTVKRKSWIETCSRHRVEFITGRIAR